MKVKELITLLSEKEMEKEVFVYTNDVVGFDFLNLLIEGVYDSKQNCVILNCLVIENI